MNQMLPFKEILLLVLFSFYIVFLLFLQLEFKIFLLLLSAGLGALYLSLNIFEELFKRKSKKKQNNKNRKK